MSSVSVSVAPSNKAVALKSDIAAGDSVTPSSDNVFSGIFDSSLSAAESTGGDVKTSDTLERDSSVKSDDETDLSSAQAAQAESAADILMTLQISRQMDMSLQLPPQQPMQSLPMDISSSDVSDVSDVSTGEESETSIPTNTNVASSPLFSDIKSRSEVEKSFAKDTNPSNGKLVDTMPSDAVDVIDSAAVINTSSVTDSIASSTSVAMQAQSKIDKSIDRNDVTSKNSIPVPEEIKNLDATNAKSVAPSLDLSDALSEKTEQGTDTEALSSSNAVPSFDVSGALSVETETKIDASSSSVVAPSAKHGKSAKNEQTTDAEPIVTDAIIAPQVAAPDMNTVRDQIQAEVSSATDKMATKASDTAISADQKASRHTEQAVAIDSNDSSTITSSDESSTDESSTKSLLGGDTEGTTTTSTVTNSDASSTPDLDGNPEQSANKNMTTNMASQESTISNAVTKSGSTTTAATSTDHTQNLRHITEQLPSVYVKNGQIDEHELSARVILMAGQKWQEAEIQLEPQGMGKIRVQLSIDQEQQTHVQFMVQHSQAKEAIDQSMPRLRELLSQHGLQPGQTQVQQQSQESSNQSWNQQMANNGTAEQRAQRGNSSAGNATSSANDDDFVQTVTVSASDAAGIDFYA